MKNWLVSSTLLMIVLSFSSCDAIAGLFKTGVWTGIIIVVVIVAVVLWLLSKLFGGRR